MSLFSAIAVASAGLLTAQQVRPTFREAVDVIEIDVRVVDNAGAPIAGLGPDAFDVSIGGKKRRVVSAQLVRYDRPSAESAAAPPPADQPATPPPIWAAPNRSLVAASQGRLFVLHVDADSFDAMSARNILATAGTFIDRLQPNDRVGLAIFPVGSQIEPTTEHEAVKGALAKVMGMPSATIASRMGEFALRPSEVDLLSYALLSEGLTGGATSGRRQSAEPLIDAICGTDADCSGRRLPNEVRGLALEYESQASQGLNNIRAVLQGLASVEGRKILVVLSGGIPTSNRPGSRPDIANLDVEVGQEAQRSNTAIYALYVDWYLTGLASAEQKRPPRQFTSPSEDSAMLSRSLDVFAGASGGTFLKVLSGRGEAAFDQILRETSAYYLLGVEPAESDRDGKAKQLSVKVATRGATVHGSRWVTVPRRQ